jgi:predicted O-linked N-acetylglucosamine transferase (SPINDLY family)
MSSARTGKGKDSPEPLFAQAVTLHRSGKLRDAEAMYRKVLALDPRHHRALYSLSLIALGDQRNQAAADLLRRAVAIDPDSVAYHSNLGEAYRRLGRLREAVEALLRALALKRDFAEGFYNLAVVLQQNGELEGAIAHFERAVELKPEAAVFQRGLGEALARAGDPQTAAGHLACAWLRTGGSARPADTFVSGSKQPPELAESSYERAVVLEEQGDLAGAIIHYEISVDARPAEARFQLGLARALRESGSLFRSVAHYQCALALLAGGVPEADVLVELSRVFEALGRVEGAQAASLRALDLAPDSAMAHATLGAVRLLQARYDEAIASCRRALQIDPVCWLAHLHLGNSLVAHGEVAEALDCYRRTLEIFPNQHAAHSSLVFLLGYVPGVDTQALGREARAWAAQRADPLAGEIRAHDRDRDPLRRLRVGYVSPDFREHPVAVFLEPLLANHDKKQVEVFCYSSVRSADAVTAHLRTMADQWRDVRHAGDAAVAQLVREDRIDLLVDLTMHTSGGRPLLFARKPAPVQLCWLAYVGTTGLRTMDYRLTDPHLEPPEADPGWSTEAPLVLPDTFWCYAPLRPVMGTAPMPEAGPLPAAASGHVTFGSQHSIPKIHAGVLALWARVMRAVEGSRLVMFAHPGNARDRVLGLMEREGIERGRVDFLPTRARRVYLESYRGIDLCLDTFPCNGATTSLDAFWMGVPVVTLVGNTPFGRAGLSIATNLGLPELVARTEDEYANIAIGLAKDLDRLSGLRRGLRDRMQASPLMDASRFARNVEAAYRTAWTTWCTGQRSTAVDGSTPQ